MLDASAAVELLLDLPRARAIVDRLLAEGSESAAPHLIDAEVGQVLRRLVGAGGLDAARARKAIDALFDLGVHRYPHGRLLPRAFELRNNATIYDGLYLALAEALDVPLLTRDGRLARVPGSSARVAVV